MEVIMPMLSLSWLVKDTDQVKTIRGFVERVFYNFHAIRLAAANGGQAQDASIRFITDDTLRAQWSMTIQDSDHTYVYISITSDAEPTVHLTVKENGMLAAQYKITINRDDPAKEDWRFVIPYKPDEPLSADLPRIEGELEDITFWLTQLVSLLPEEGG